jgi:Predicted periplasmic protein
VQQAFRAGLVAASAVTAFLAWTAPASAQDARAILKSMADYVGAQKNISATFESDIEVLTSDLEKIQFTSSGRMALTRPDKLYAQRTGGYADVELFYDGKTVTIRDRGAKVASRIDAPATIDELVDELREKYAVEAPGADLLLSDTEAALINGVVEAKYIGRGVVDGVECEHLAFRNDEVDWQLWVAVGPKPIPHKYVITNKAVTGAPQYTLRIREWSEADVGADRFAMQSGDTKLVAFGELGHIDEVPAGIVRENKP